MSKIPRLQSGFAPVKVILILVVILAGVGIAFLYQQVSESGPSPPITPNKVISINRQEFSKGESVEFSINAEVELWTNEIPFEIVDEQGNSVNLIHTCDGEAGNGFDQFCEAGQIVVKDVYQVCSISPLKKWCRGCSDAIWQREEYINEAFIWDQKEYVKITEECEGRTISREEKRQVEMGEYKIVVRDSEGNVHEKTFLIK